MTVKRAEAINGWSISVRSERGPRGGRQFIAVGISPDGATKTMGEAGSESTALSVLVKAIYLHNRMIVYRRANGRCENCTRVGPGDVHHKVKRSKERNDRVENLIYLCTATCHPAEHGGM